MNKKVRQTFVPRFEAELKLVPVDEICGEEICRCFSGGVFSPPIALEVLAVSMFLLRSSQLELPRLPQVVGFICS